MVLNPDDVNFTYSGGVLNSDPNESIGGEPSNVTISGNTLFDNITESETTNGMIDYRCFYFNNDSLTEILYNAQAYIEYEAVSSMVTIQIGFNFVNDLQKIIIDNATTMTGVNTFKLIYETEEIPITLNSWVDDNTVADWALAIQNGIRSLQFLGDVEVSGAAPNNGTVSFNVEFKGSARHRFHPLLDTTDVSFSNDGTIGTLKSVDGSPINSQPSPIDVETTPPTNVVFYTTDSNDKITIGDIRNTDVLPVWIKRITPNNTIAVENDGFTFYLVGSSLI